MKILHALLLALVTSVPLAAAELPGDSLYQLDVRLTDQNGHDFRFGEHRGRPQLVSMFYTSCQYACPLIIDTLKQTQRALTPVQVPVLLVSFDPVRDTPVRLHEVFDQRKIDRSSWTLARASADDVRELAAALDIQYRALGSDINHSSALILLDAAGRIAARTDKIGEVDPEFVAKVQAALRARADQ